MPDQQTPIPFKDGNNDGKLNKKEFLEGMKNPEIRDRVRKELEDTINTIAMAGGKLEEYEKGDNKGEDSGARMALRVSADRLPGNAAWALNETLLDKLDKTVFSKVTFTPGDLPEILQACGVQVVKQKQR